MKFFKIIIWPIIFAVGQFFIRLLFVLYFNNKYYGDVNLYDVIDTYEYQNKLNHFIDSNTLFIVIITALIFIPLLFLIYKKNKYNYEVLGNFKIYKYLILGLSFAVFYNLYLSFIIDYKVSGLPIYIQIISSGIVGPIIEELLFRGIVYNRLKKYYSINISMILSTIIFSFMHFSIINIIYTLFFGYLLVFVYESTNNIKYSMIIHMCSNIIVILLGLFINIFFFNITLLIINFMIICVLLFRKYIFN